MQRDPKGHVVVRQLSGEVRLDGSAGGIDWIVRDSGRDIELMHAAITRAIGVELESSLSNGTKLRDERRHYILLAEAVRNQIERWILSS